MLLEKIKDMLGKKRIIVSMDEDELRRIRSIVEYHWDNNNGDNFDNRILDDLCDIEIKVNKDEQ